MFVFVWEYTGNVSGAYHDGGGLLVVAESLARAREMINEAVLGDGRCGAMDETPDKVWAMAGRGPLIASETVIAFPDAGCC